MRDNSFEIFLFGVVVGILGFYVLLSLLGAFDAPAA